MKIKIKMQHKKFQEIESEKNVTKKEAEHSDDCMQGETL